MLLAPTGRAAKVLAQYAHEKALTIHKRIYRQRTNADYESKFSLNINPEREYPSMFEPVHGSAPDIAGKNIANPIGQIWSGAMMLEHLGHKEAADAIVAAIEEVIRTGETLTPDMGGKASTQDLGKAIADIVRG